MKNHNMSVKGLGARAADKGTRGKSGMKMETSNIVSKSTGSKFSVKSPSLPSGKGSRAKSQKGM